MKLELNVSLNLPNFHAKVLYYCKVCNDDMYLLLFTAESLATGLIEYDSADDATSALILMNHYTIPNPG